MDEIAPVVTNIINKSIITGIVPSNFKKAIIRPLLKKENLDQNELKNYRPVSNLSFLSKILEKVVMKQLIEHIELNHLSEFFQSAYKLFHSTETALLRVVNDTFKSLDKGNSRAAM